MLSVEPNARSGYLTIVLCLVRTSRFFLSSILSERNIANDCLPIVYANFLTKTKDERSGTNENQKHKKKWVKKKH